MRKTIWLFFPATLLVLTLTALPGQVIAASQIPQPRSVITATHSISWTVANNAAAAEWLVYTSADDVSAAVVDGTNLWVASTGGLLRWNRQDGSVIQYLAPQVPLPSNNLEQLLLHDGKLYISAYRGVAIFDRKSQWRTYRDEEIGLKGAWFGAMALIDDVLWVGSDQGLAKLYPDGHWDVVLPGPQTFPLSQVTNIEKRSDGVYITATDPAPSSEHKTVVARYTPGRWQTIDTQLQPLPDHIIAPDGSWWKSEQDRVKKSIDQGQTWQTVYEGSIWPRPLAFDQDEVFLAGDKGVVVLKGNRVVANYRFADVGPELNYVNIIKHDESGRMWLGTDGRGLTMFDGQRWYNWQPENSAVREDAVRGMALANGKIYLGLFGCGGCGGVAIYDVEADRWTNLWPGESELSGGGVGGIAIDKQGRAYFPTSKGILDIYDNGKWQHIKMTPMLGNIILSPKDGLFDKQGHYWLATSGLGLGLWEYDGREWQTHLNGYDVNALATDKDGRIWAATSTGLAVRDIDGSWHVYTSNKYPLRNGWLQDIEIDSDGRIWTIATDDLYIFNGKDWQIITPDTVGASSWEGSIGFDGQHRAWIGMSFSGVAIFTGQPKIGPFVGLVDPPAFQERQPRVTESKSSPWSLLTQGLCLLVLAPGAVAFERVYRISHKRAKS